jgi:hypothetical protein
MSRRGTFLITPGIDIGVTEEPLKQPVLQGRKSLR